MDPPSASIFQCCPCIHYFSVRWRSSLGPRSVYFLDVLRQVYVLLGWQDRLPLISKSIHSSIHGANAGPIHIVPCSFLETLEIAMIKFKNSCFQIFHYVLRMRKVMCFSRWMTLSNNFYKVKIQWVIYSQVLMCDPENIHVNHLLGHLSWWLKTSRHLAKIWEDPSRMELPT